MELAIRSIYMGCFLETWEMYYVEYTDCIPHVSTNEMNLHGFVHEKKEVMDKRLKLGPILINFEYYLKYSCWLHYYYYSTISCLYE